MKHTKGEWKSVKSEAASEIYIMSTASKRHLAEVSSFYRKTEEVEANAKLIAAAPELLEALTEMRFWAVCNGLDIDSKLNLIASNAINKATL